VSWYHKETSLDFTKARDSDWQSHQQVYTSLQTDNHASTLPLSFFTGWMPFLPPMHCHTIDKYLDTLLANQTVRKALPPTIDKSRSRKMADCWSYY